MWVHWVPNKMLHLHEYKIPSPMFHFRWWIREKFFSYMWHIVLNYVTVTHYRNSEACLYILSVFMFFILRFSRSWYGKLRCITVGGNSDAQSLYRFILWPRIAIHKVSCLYFLPWSQKTPLSRDSTNRGFPFTISVFLQLCVCIMLLRSLMEFIFLTLHIPPSLSNKSD